MTEHRREHRGQAVELRERDGEPELLIDGKPASYGQLPDGQYFIYEHAYDWSDDLMEVATRLIDHRARADEQRAKAQRSEDA